MSWFLRLKVYSQIWITSPETNLSTHTPMLAGGQVDQQSVGQQIRNLSIPEETQFSISAQSLKERHSLDPILISSSSVLCWESGSPFLSHQQDLIIINFAFWDEREEFCGYILWRKCQMSEENR